MTKTEAICAYCVTKGWKPYQVMRVLELISKHGENTRYHLTKKQNKILNDILEIWTDKEIQQ